MISVIIPAHNRTAMLERAVNSVLQQTYQDFELIVVDDGSSTDQSAVIRLVREGGHEYLAIPKQGVATARNTGLECSQGDWICLLDSDDLWLPEKLEKQTAYHHQYPELLISQTRELWYRNGKRVNKKKAHQQPIGNAFPKSLEICCISSSSVMFKREVFENCGPYDEQMTVCEDYDFWLRVSRRYPLGLVPEILVEKFGGHDDQLSKSVPAMDRFRLYALLKLLITEELTSAQQELVLHAIKYRAGVLHLGAKKRGFPQKDTYKEILEVAGNNQSTAKDDLDSFLPRLEELIRS